MDVKDSVVRLYVKRFILPRALIFDKPGFVDFKISGKTNIFARQVLVPESLFTNFEKNLTEQFGEKGKQILYSIGKKFGYSFSQLGRFENIKDHPGDAVKDWISIASKFVEGTYASEISQTSDVNKKTVNYVLKNFVICRKLGYDYFLANGGAAGVIAWLLQDKTIESVLYDNTFSGEGHVCKVMCAPPSVLKEKWDKILIETDLDGLNQDPRSYYSFNEEKDIQYKKSFQTYLDSKIFTYRNGIIQQGTERFFLMEISGMYLFELGLKEKSTRETLFNSAVETGKNLFKDIKTNSVSDLMELLSALGWGEVTFLGSKNKFKVVIKYFPWTKWYGDIDFLVISGLLSGIFSTLYKKTIKFNKPSIDISSGSLNLIFEV